jgi:hypothetical protein
LKKITVLGIIMAFVAILVAPVFANNIVIEPTWPAVVESGETLTIYINSNDPGYDPHVFLAMPYSCWDGLTGPVVVTWTGGSVSIAKGEFMGPEDGSDPGYKLPTDPLSLPVANDGIGYTVPSLQSHLETDEDIYWAFRAFLADDLTLTPQDFTVDLPSTAPKMLVYALARVSVDGAFSDKVPPTNPGFVVPEVATIMLATASIGALSLYALKRRNK